MEWHSRDRLLRIYRRAKADAFYERGQLIVEAFSAYETDLERRLDRFAESCRGGHVGDLPLGTLYQVPRRIDWAPTEPTGLATVVETDPLKSFNLRAELSNPRIVFRSLAVPSVELRLVSSLWLTEIGGLVDSRLGRCAKGNRLRRAPNSDQFNEHAYSTFKPYIENYRQWRDGAVGVARQLVKQDRDVAVLSFDIQGFYSSVGIEVLESRLFWDALKIALTPTQVEVNSLLIQAIRRWNAEKEQRGLPIGLPASAVIANAALVDLDRQILRQSPHYYSRYVDDFLLVVDQSRTDLGLYLAPQVQDWDQKIRLAYLDKPLELAAKKTRVIKLSGESGAQYLDALQRHFSSLSSEWRLLPTQRTFEKVIGSVLQSGSGKHLPEQLRYADEITVRRMAFALGLSKFRDVARDLNPSEWGELFRKFFDVCKSYVFSAEGCVDFAFYYGELLELAYVAGRQDVVRELEAQVAALLTTLESVSAKDPLECWRSLRSAEIWSGSQAPATLCADASPATAA